MPKATATNALTSCGKPAGMGTHCSGEKRPIHKCKCKWKWKWKCTCHQECSFELWQAVMKRSGQVHMWTISPPKKKPTIGCRYDAKKGGEPVTPAPRPPSKAPQGFSSPELLGSTKREAGGGGPGGGGVGMLPWCVVLVQASAVPRKNFLCCGMLRHASACTCGYLHFYGSRQTRQKG